MFGHNIAFLTIFPTPVPFLLFTHFPFLPLPPPPPPPPPTSHYQVVAVLLPRGVDLADLREPDMQFPTINSLGTYSDINCGSLGTSATGYITAEFGDNLFPNDNMFIVGDPNQPNDRPNNYTNGQLCSATKYTFFVRAYTVVSRLIIYIHCCVQSFFSEMLDSLATRQSCIPNPSYNSPTN